MKTDNLLNVYSAYSGILYTINADEFKLLDDGQLPLTKTPPSCKKCYNRGYIGFSQQKYIYTICSCIHKLIDTEKLKLKFSKNTPNR